MAVENPEAPGGEHEEASAGEENPDQMDAQFPLVSSKAIGDDGDQLRGCPKSQQHEDGDCEAEDGGDRPGNFSCFLLFPSREQSGIDGDERRR